ncbi:MAG TPA: HIT domain-containing protein [Thermodesulfobacteriota bacterium]|nr:HIT domain-containing protein [Thermodesulfobacteriota bacterium]
MQRLWAPWRMEYVGGAHDAGGCLFCDALADADAAKRLVLWRGPLAFVMLNRYPYAHGHLMIAPVTHVADPAGLTPAEGQELMRLVGECTRRLTEAMAPHGFNVGMNLGRVAGAGVEGHLHLHVVPRWNGDTNFMPVLADVRVMPQHLADTYAALAPRFAALPPPDR